jgi:hypothetical protein
MKIGEMYSADLTEAIQNILNVFSGADNGISYVNFCNFMRSIDKQAIETQNPNAEALKIIVLQFNRLLENVCRAGGSLNAE